MHVNILPMQGLSLQAFEKVKMFNTKQELEIQWDHYW
jgi:hypothetical protein